MVIWRFLALLGMAVVCNTAIAETVLQVHTTGGETVSIAINEIDFIDFELDSIRSVSDMEDFANVINSFKLLSNHPNPFNPTTNISYELAQPGDVEIIIFDVMGKRIKTLISERQVAGSYQSQWNGESDLGVKVAGGMYFYQLSFNGSAQTKKMLLVK